MAKTLIKITTLAIIIKVQHLAYVKNLVVQKYAKFDKYAKPKYLCQPPPKNAKFQKFGIKICQLATLVVCRIGKLKIETFADQEIGR